MEKNVYQIIRDWHGLLKSGVITELEFIEKKNELLGKPNKEQPFSLQQSVPTITQEERQAIDAEYEAIFNNKTWFQKNKSWAVALLIVLLVGILIWYFANNNSGEFSDNNFKEQKQIIESLIRAENERDFSEMENLYSTNIRRNWDLYNPTNEQLQKAYTQLWSVTYSATETIEDMEATNDTTIKASISNVYYPKKTNARRQKTYDVYYVFDINNKLVETYGYLKKTE